MLSHVPVEVLPVFPEQEDVDDLLHDVDEEEAAADEQLGQPLLDVPTLAFHSRSNLKARGEI